MQTRKSQLFAALQAFGMPKVPDEFSVVPWPQVISPAIMAEIENFIRVFEQVTTRASWREGVIAEAPEIARQLRPEVCFFSAWDFHLPPEQAWQLIEFNDNGSGLLFAGRINDLFYQLFDLAQEGALSPPLPYAELTARILRCVEREAQAFFGEPPQGLYLILEDAEALQEGKFRRELLLLRDLFRRRGWETEIATPAEVERERQGLRWQGKKISFIVNRSTDFLWEGKVFAAVRAAYSARQVYVAPNPFTYSTRSDKRLLERLSRSDWDQSLGIRPEERTVLSAHVPETHVLRPENVEEIAQRKEAFVFKPAQGFAARGLLASDKVGRSRLRRLLREGAGYVAQKKVPKNRLQVESTADGTSLWTDLRVWAYRGEILMLSGRASSRPEKLDLSPPGGWLPTYLALT